MEWVRIDPSIYDHLIATANSDGVKILKLGRKRRLRETIRPVGPVALAGWVVDRWKRMVDFEQFGGEVHIRCFCGLPSERKP